MYEAAWAYEGYSRWSLRLLSEKMVELRYVDSLSHETVGRVLKKNELKPWKSHCWVIPPKQNSAFVAAMEQVLNVYKRPYDPLHPVVCMDESPRQLISESRKPVAGRPGRIQRYDYEYIRKGVYNVFLGCEPLQGTRFIEIHQRRTKQDWARFLRHLSAQYPRAERITLVMDNLNTHSTAALYETFDPGDAKVLWDRFEFIYTPKHGS